MPGQGFKPRFDLLREVAKDLRYLLARGYHKEPAINFLSNRWQLSSLEREILKRAIFSEKEAKTRREKRLKPHLLRGKILYVDGFNCLTTIRSALKGDPVFLADDGFLRDAGCVARKFSLTEPEDTGLEILISALKKLPIKEVVIFLDKPVSKSGELASTLRELLAEAGLKGRVELVPSSDRALEGLCPVASSDTVVLDRAGAAFDLAAHALKSCGFSFSSLASHHGTKFEDGEIKGNDDTTDDPA